MCRNSMLLFCQIGLIFFTSYGQHYSRPIPVIKKEIKAHEKAVQGHSSSSSR